VLFEPGFLEEGSYLVTQNLNISNLVIMKHILLEVDMDEPRKISNPGVMLLKWS
jgi:hypothetical protein